MREQILGALVIFCIFSISAQAQVSDTQGHGGTMQPGWDVDQKAQAEYYKEQSTKKIQDSDKQRKILEWMSRKPADHSVKKHPVSKKIPAEKQSKDTPKIKTE